MSDQERLHVAYTLANSFDGQVRNLPAEIVNGKLYTWGEAKGRVSHVVDNAGGASFVYYEPDVKARS